MKNIVICCDGTGNEFGDTNSNVVKLYSTLIIDHDQIGYYHPGVGTMGAPNARGPIEEEWTKIEGLAFGKGLLENVGDAYRYLMNNYEDGDHIYLFGFSRGAYTVRALGGVLHMFGLLTPGNEGQIPYIIRMFAEKSRNAAGAKRTLGEAGDFKWSFSRDCLLHFVGVWDTVSSIAWTWRDPIVLPYAGSNPIIHIARHALSIDERRVYFRDMLWGPPYERSDPQFRVEQDIKQAWFAGVHSDVGGSYPEAQSGLSKITLEWMVAEAQQFGLRIDPGKAETVLGKPDHSKGTDTAMQYVQPDSTAMVHESLKGPWWVVEVFPHKIYRKSDKLPHWTIPLGSHRTIPEGSLIHNSVFDRMEKIETYRPRNLPFKYQIEPMVEFRPQYKEKTAAAS